VPEYVEFAPPPHLADAVECFWAMRHPHGTAVPHRVLPDGCADILFTSGCGKSTLQIVGAMTRFEDFRVLPGQVMVGLRFHPGMWSRQLRVSADLITDRVLPMEELRGKRAVTLLAQLEDVTSPQDCAALLAKSLTGDYSLTPFQRALNWMRARHGGVSLDYLGTSIRFEPSSVSACVLAADWSRAETPGPHSPPSLLAFPYSQQSR
jgi:hypothetical protein